MPERGKEAKSVLYVWNGFLYYLRPGISNTMHSHYSASILFGPDTQFTVETGDGSISAFAIYLPPHFEHSLKSDGWILVIHIDPDSIEYAPLKSLEKKKPHLIQGKDLSFLDSRILDSASGQIPPARIRELVRDIVRLFPSGVKAQPEAGSPVDGRIAKTRQYLETLPEMPERISAAELAKMAGLSVDRYRHLFQKELGITIRRYILWTRLRRAAFLLEEGVSITSAAHAAGFSDSAHFANVFKENFGITPSFIFGSREGLKIFNCEEEDQPSGH